MRRDIITQTNSIQIPPCRAIVRAYFARSASDDRHSAAPPATVRYHRPTVRPTNEAPHPSRDQARQPSDRPAKRYAEQR